MCLYFQFPVVWKRVKRRIGGRRMADFSIGLAKIDRPGNSRYYFMLHPLSGVLHVKRKARKRVLHIRSFDLCHSFAYGLRYWYLAVVGSTRRCISRLGIGIKMRWWTRGSCYKISAMCRPQLRDEDVAQRCPRAREFLEYHLDGSRFPLNCTTRLNLHYPIVDTAPPSSAVLVWIDAHD